MSQVRKFGEGGTSSATRDNTSKSTAQTAQSQTVLQNIPGTEAVVIKKAEPETSPQPTVNSYFIWDGDRFENTEETRKKFANFSASVASETGGSPWYDQIIKLAEQAEKEGGNIVYSTPSNTISFLDKDGVDKKIDWDSLNDRQDNRIQRERTWLGRFLDANSGSKVQRMAEDIHKLSGFKDWMKRQTTAAIPETTVNPEYVSVDWGGNSFFTYLKDQDGNLIKDTNGNLQYDVNNPTNAKLMRAITRASAWLEASDDDRKLFQLAKEYEDGANLLAIYNANPERFKTSLKNALNRITSGQRVLPEDLSLLALFGISQAAPTEEEIAKKQADITLQNWTNAGYEDIYDKANGWFTLDENGDLVLNEDGITALGNYGISNTGGYELNDEWIDYLKDKGYYSPDLDWLNGFTLYDGKLYRTASGENPKSKLAQILASSGFITANRENRYADAQKIINTFWGKPYEWLSYDPNYYSSFLYDPETGQYNGYQYRPVTGQFTGLAPNEQLVQFYRPDAKRDYKGFVKDDNVWYAILDEVGNFVPGERGSNWWTLTDLKNMNIIPATNPTDIPFTQSRLAVTPDTRLQRHIRHYLTTDKSVAIYYNPTKTPKNADPESWLIYYSADLDNGSAYLVPPILARLLLSKDQNGVSNITKFAGNRVMREALNTLLKKITDKNDNWWNNIIVGKGNGLLGKILSWCGAGNNDNSIYFNEIKKWREINRIEKEDNFKIGRNIIDAAYPSSQTVQTEKKGGTIPKFAPGGGFGKAASSSGSAVKTESNKYKDTRKSEEIDIAELLGVWKSLSKADRADMIALGVDLASVGLGSMPIAGGITGLVGTGIGTYADIKRDGFQIGDALWGLGSGIVDVVSMLPGIGSGTQAAKFAAKAMRTIKPIGAMLGAYGAVHSLPLLSKLSSEGTLTAQEWHQLGVDLAGAINLARSGGPGKRTKPGDYKNIEVKSAEDVMSKVTIKPKNLADGSMPTDVPEIKFTEAQVKELNAITDPILKAAKARKMAWEQIAASNPDLLKGTDGAPLSRAEVTKVKNEFLKKYDFSDTRVFEPTKKVAVKPTDPRSKEKTIYLSKEDVDEINAIADPIARKAKFEEKLEWRIGEAYRRNQKEHKKLVQKYTMPHELKVNPEFTIKSNLPTTKDVTLDKTDIEKIVSKKTPDEQQKEFIDIIKTKSGDNSLDSIEKIKESYNIDDFFAKRRGDFDWKHPWESTRKKDTFTINPEREIVGAPVRGNGWEGAFGFRDWWHGNGATPIFGYSRALPTEADLLRVKATPTTPSGTPTPGVTTKTGVNFFNSLFYRPGKNYYTPRVMNAGNIFGKKHEYETMPAPGSSEDETNNTLNGVAATPVIFEQGGQVPKYWSGGKALKDLASGVGNLVDKIGTDNLIDWGVKMPMNLANSRKIENISTNLYKDVPMKTALQYQIPGYYDNGIQNQGNELMQSIYNRGSNVYTSDPRQTAWIQNMRGEEATKYQHNINTRESNAISTWKKTTDEYRNKNLVSANTTEDENRKQLFAAETATATAKQKRIQENNQSFNNLFTDVVSKYREDQKAFNTWKAYLSNANYKSEVLKQLGLQAGYTTAKAEYQKYVAENPGVSFESWLIGAGASYKPAYDEAVSAAQTEAYKVIGGQDFSKFGWFSSEAEKYWDKFGKNLSLTTPVTSSQPTDTTTTSTVTTSKKGGTISKKTDPREKLWIQQNKEAYDAIASMNKHTQQLLLKMLK